MFDIFFKMKSAKENSDKLEKKYSGERVGLDLFNEFIFRMGKRGMKPGLHCYFDLLGLSLVTKGDTLSFYAYNNQLPNRQTVFLMFNSSV